MSDEMVLDESLKRILKANYGFGIEGKEALDKNHIHLHQSLSGLRYILYDIPKSTFYRKIRNLEGRGYITISKDKKRLVRNFEIVHDEKISIPPRAMLSKEVRLTEKGKEAVSEFLIEELPRRIDVIDEGKTKRMFLIDAVNLIKEKFNIEIHTAFIHLLGEIERKKLPIDLQKLGQRVSEKKVRYILKTPVETRDFVGREGYLKMLLDSLNEYNIVSVVGLAGIGKSYFLSHFYHQLKDYKRFWWDFSRDSTDLNVVLNTIAGFLETYYNDTTLLKYFNETKTRDWRIVESILRDTLDKNTILFFDNYHVLDEKEEREIWKLFDLLECSLILCSREKISRLQFMKTSEVALEKGFSKAEIKEFLKNRNQKFSEKRIERIYSLTKGIPYLIDGFSKIYTPASDFEDLASKVEEGSFDFVHREVIKNLSKWEKLILNWASAFRRNEGFEAYDYVYEGEEPVRVVLNILVNEKKHLLQTSRGEYIIHDLLRDHFYENLGKDSLNYHKKAAEYYLSRKNPENLIEAMHH
ncbi:MAG: hypothetical protein ACE5K0_13020, partial [Candidatus Methanofastidiosia archaeon]